MVAVALLTCACGDVLKVPDAAAIDAYVPDSPVPPLMCGTGEMNCNGTCAKVMTSELYCGNCTTQCSPTQGCLAGSCVPANTTCARVRELEPTATDGLYTNPNNGVRFYCDFTNSMTYDAFGFGAFNIVYAGYTLMSSADFNSAPVQKAFIALYNSQAGLLNIGGGFASGNCCLKASDAAAGQMLHFNAHSMRPADANTGAQVCLSSYPDPKYRIFELVVNSSPLPLPDDYFATRPATVATACSDSNNPGVFVKRRNGLN